MAVVLIMDMLLLREGTVPWGQLSHRNYEEADKMKVLCIYNKYDNPNLEALKRLRRN